MDGPKQIQVGNPHKAICYLVAGLLMAVGLLEIRNHILLGSYLRPWIVEVEDQTSSTMVRDYKEYQEEQDRKKRR